MGTAAAPKRSHGIDPWLVERRRQLTAIVREHLSRYPGEWFSAYELARVIREQYLKEPPLTRSRYGYGRTNVLASILRELRDTGDVEQGPGRRKGTTLWRMTVPAASRHGSRAGA